MSVPSASDFAPNETLHLGSFARCVFPASRFSAIAAIRLHPERMPRFLAGNAVGRCLCDNGELSCQ